jgi:hypothetical protein
MKTQGEAKPESPPLARQTRPGFILRGLCLRGAGSPCLGGEYSCDIALMPRFGKQTQFPPGGWDAAWGTRDEGPSCEMNPIWRADCAKQSQFAPERYERQVPCRKRVMVNCTGHGPRQNKANSSIADWERPPAGGLPCGLPPRARASQSCETNPIWGLSCHTNPICGRIGGRDTPPFHYSIIPPSKADAYRAKQSQFFDCRLGTGLPPPAPGRLCKTNPIPRLPIAD